MSIPADDRSAILELAARYIHAFDRADYRAWGECFSDDAIFEPAPGVRVVGREALRKYAESLDTTTPSRHAPATIRIRGDGKSATMRSYFTLMPLDDPANFNAIGRYEDRLAKINGEWKLSERRVITDWKKGG